VGALRYYDFMIR